MFDDTRMFRRGDPDFPTTRAAQQRLIDAGRVTGEGPLHFVAGIDKTVAGASVSARLPIPEGPSIPLGETDRGTLHLDLNKLLAGRCLIQGSSGAGKSATLRHLIEEAFDYLTIMIVDPEGEFGNLAEHIRAATIHASEIAADGLTAAALRARHHRLPLHLDLTDLEPDVRIQKASSFFSGLLASSREDWTNTVLVAIDEAHLLAPHVAASARDAETRRLGVATLTDLCGRGRKRGISCVIATQRLAKLATSVVSELHNTLLGLNIFDRDVARAGDLLGFGSEKAAALRELRPGEFFALGPALCPLPMLVRIAPTVTRHVDATPDLVASADVTPDEARNLLDLDALREVGRAGPACISGRAGVRALDGFLLDQHAATAARVVAALRAISPNATTAADLCRHLAIETEAIHGALHLLASAGAVDTMPRGDARIARLSARLRLRTSDTTVGGAGMSELPFDLIELAPCPALPAAFPDAPLRETAFRENAWLPEDIDTLRTMFAADAALEDIAERLDRGLAGVRSKITELGLRRNSVRPWSGLDDETLAQRYGHEAASAIAAALGRSVAAIYARAKLLDLTDDGAQPYTEWELTQIRTAYGRGVPVAQLGVLIGRPASGIATVASRLGIRHANGAPDWSDAEQQRALELAETGISYTTIAERLAAEGFSQRMGRTVGQTLRRLGYGRGWGRFWIREEDDLLRDAYAQGKSLTPLRDRLGRSRTSIAYRAGELGLHGTHVRPNGWRTEPPWTEEEIAALRRDYGRVKTPELAARLGRRKAAVYNKAFTLGLKHGFMRAFSDDEERAIRAARDHGVSLTDLSAALGRDVSVLSKHAIAMGIPFGTRPRAAPRGPRAGRPAVTLQTLLALAAGQPADNRSGIDVASEGESHPPSASRSRGPEKLLVALPELPPMPSTMLHAMHEAGLLRATREGPGVVLLTALPTA